MSYLLVIMNVTLIVAMIGVFLLFKEFGLDFTLGVLFAAVVFHVGYRCKHGEWWSN